MKCSCPKPGPSTGPRCHAERYGFHETADEWCNCRCHEAPSGVKAAIAGDDLERLRALATRAGELAERIAAAAAELELGPALRATLRSAAREVSGGASLLEHVQDELKACARCGHTFLKHRTPGAECCQVTGRDAQGFETYCGCGAFK